MRTDAQGHALSAATDEAVRAYDWAIAGFLDFRADTAQRLAALLATDQAFGMGHVLKGYLAMAVYDGAFVPRAQQALADARQRLAHATPREQAHAEALSHWAGGDIDRAIGVWEAILAEHPRDALALRMQHFGAFWTGQPERMRAAVQGVLPHWSSELPGWGMVLGCGAFADEECGRYGAAEALGRQAIALDATNVWATHALAHVLEMQGRPDEGIELLGGLERHWDGANAIKHHLWWHWAMYHLERGEHDAALDLYDRRFRDLASPLVVTMPDFALDVQNAASMLLRLELRGVAVGERWVELADKAQARIGDWASPFTLPHRMMALAAAGRWAAAERMLQALSEAVRAPRGACGDASSVLADAALPVCKAVLAHRRGDHAGAVAAMRPALGVMHRLGGSHAQQDVLEQLYLDAALKAGLIEDVRLLLQRVASRHPVPPQRRAGYAEAARLVAH